MFDALLLISDILAKCNRIYTALLQEKTIEGKAEYSLRNSMLVSLLLPYGNVRFQETTNVFILDIAAVDLVRDGEQITITGTVGGDGYDIHMTRGVR
jgi:hypothetical protein